MLTVRNARAPERTLTAWFRENHATLIGLGLFAIALLWLAGLGQTMEENVEGWFSVASLGFGLL